MSSFVWCEWICSRCGYIHRTRFDLIISLKAAYQLRGRLFEREGIAIEDIAFNLKDKPKRGKRKAGSRVYVKWNTQIDQIFAALKEYMPKYYAIKENTLKMEVCRS